MVNKFKSTKTKEQKSVEMKNILETLEKGVRDVFDSERYKKYLEFFGKFHNYSFNNTILILMQCPNAKRCASYATWTKLKMPVKKGERGIRILVPIPYKYEKKINLNDEDTEIITGIRYRVGHVYDISQVEGAVPEIAEEIKHNPKYLKPIIESLLVSSKVSVFYDISLRKGDANGYYNPCTDSIALREGMSTLQTFKTLLHETAHSILHKTDSEKYTREEAEVQAESVAFVVCTAFELDTSGYSFGYIANWSTGKELAELKNSISLIEKTSREIINWITSATNLKLAS